MLLSSKPKVWTEIVSELQEVQRKNLAWIASSASCQHPEGVRTDISWSNHREAAGLPILQVGPDEDM